MLGGGCPEPLRGVSRGGSGSGVLMRGCRAGPGCWHMADEPTVLPGARGAPADRQAALVPSLPILPAWGRGSCPGWSSRPVRASRTGSKQGLEGEDFSDHQHRSPGPSLKPCGLNGCVCHSQEACPARQWGQGQVLLGHAPPVRRPRPSPRGAKNGGPGLRRG